MYVAEGAHLSPSKGMPPLHIQEQLWRAQPPPWEPYRGQAHLVSSGPPAFAGVNVNPAFGGTPMKVRQPLSTLCGTNGANGYAMPAGEDVAHIQASLNMLDVQRLKLAKALQSAQSAQAARMQQHTAPAAAVPQIPSLVAPSWKTPPLQIQEVVPAGSPLRQRSNTQPQDMGRPVLSPDRPKSRSGSGSGSGVSESPEKIRERLLPDPNARYVLKSGTAEQTAMAAAAAAAASRKLGNILVQLNQAEEDEVRAEVTYRNSARRSHAHGRVGSVWTRTRPEELGVPTPPAARQWSRSESPGAAWGFEIPDVLPGGGVGGVRSGSEYPPAKKTYPEAPPGVQAAQAAGILPKIPPPPGSVPQRAQSASSDTTLPPGNSDDVESRVDLAVPAVQHVPKWTAAAPVCVLFYFQGVLVTNWSACLQFS